ncbi:MAG: isochorismatase family cysteine hydrolase [Chloroflexota bacterium]
MNTATLLEKSRPFLDYILTWMEERPAIPLSDVARDPQATAVISVDVINGFCHEGPLASPRVRDIIRPIVRLFEKAHALGVAHIILTQDTHDPQAVEFQSYPPHCIRGTAESESVPEFKTLPFYGRMTVIPKNSISSTIETALAGWLEERPEVNTFIVVGDCTDLCTYQLAMGLRLRANARNLRQRVIVPVDCVDTYDLPVAVAQEIGAVPHDGDLLHLVFLYSMMLNGVEVVRSLL